MLAEEATRLFRRHRRRQRSRVCFKRCNVIWMQRIDSQRTLQSTTSKRLIPARRIGTQIAPRPFRFPVGSICTRPSASRTRRVNARFASVRRHATHVRCGTCFGRGPFCFFLVVCITTSPRAVLLLAFDLVILVVNEHVRRHQAIAAIDVQFLRRCA